MKKSLPLFILLLVCLNVYSQYQSSPYFNSNSFINPVFRGDYPDPSLLVDGDDFYIVHSSFEYYPGLTIWHSKDLMNWDPVCSALKKYVGSVWAPDLVKYGDRYYIYFPAKATNYVIYADSVGGPWSDPVDLKVGNIDPGHVSDNKGRRYLYFSSGAWIELAEDGLSVKGELHHAYDGWPVPDDWTIECFCMEGPKLFKHGDWYYLTVAEGGTAGPATGHMVISARSKSPLGPWENSPFNPIIRAESSADKWWSVGHATVFEAAPGQWWMVFHGYEKDHYNMGRQTLLCPVEWTADGWFRLAPGTRIDDALSRPVTIREDKHYSLDDAFNDPDLKAQWKFFGGFDPDRIAFDNNSLLIKAKGNSIAESSPLLCIPPDHSYIAEVEVELEGNAVGGLVLFYSQKAYTGILTDGCDILANLRGWQFTTEKDVTDGHVFLRIRNTNNTVDMFYSLNGTDWFKIENSAEVSAFHHNVLSEFLSLRIGLVSMGEGLVHFRNFRYHKID